MPWSFSMALALSSITQMASSVCSPSVRLWGVMQAVLIAWPLPCPVRLPP